MTNDASGDRPTLIEELDNLHIGPAPIHDVINAGRTVKRRRRTILASVTAVALLVAGVSVASAVTNSSPNQPDEVADASDGPATQPFPDPPTGTKWVGVNGVVVAVPFDWPVSESPCGTGAPAEVIDGTSSAAVRCARIRSREAEVTFTRTDAGPEPSVGTTCAWSEPSLCIGVEPFIGQGVYVTVSARSIEQVDRVLDTAMVLPDDWTTVPFAYASTIRERATALEDAGFEVAIVDGVAGYEPVKVSPDLGSPVQKGAAITLAPAGDVTPGETPELAVTVDPLDPAMDFYVSRGAARWDAETRTLTYLSRSGYSSSCSPEGDAKFSDDGSVGLVLNEVRPPVNQVCLTDSTSAVVTIEGFIQRPPSIAVTEHGETRTVTVYETDNESQYLSVSVEQIGAGVDFAALKGTARWDENSQTLTFVPSTVYDACMTEGRATSNGPTVLLTLRRPDNGTEMVCAEIAVRVGVSITGLPEAPAELSITEDGETRTVPVDRDERSQADDPFGSLDCASNSMYSTDGGYMPRQPDGFPTREEAVEAWLEASLYNGQDYQVAPHGGSALILRADGTAEASATFYVHSGYTVRGVIGCSD